MILLDDFSTTSDIDMFLYSLRMYFPTMKLKILQASTHLGLVRGKNACAALSSGSILLFLEAHVEVFPNYLPPLLNRLHQVIILMI